MTMQPGHSHRRDVKYMWYQLLVIWCIVIVRASTPLYFMPIHIHLGHDDDDDQLQLQLTLVLFLLLNLHYQ